MLNKIPSSFLIVVFFLLGGTAIAQQKVLDTASLEIRSNDLNLKIEEYTQKIQKVESRLMSMEENETLSPEVSQSLDNLYLEREKLVNIKRSIDASLNRQVQAPDKQVILKEEFNKYPSENQQLILNHPERYIVLEQ